MKKNVLPFCRTFLKLKDNITPNKIFLFGACSKIDVYCIKFKL